MSDAPKIDPKLRFEMERIEAAARQGLQMEAAPLGPYYRLRFYNEIESVMLIGSTDQLRQIHREIGHALDLGRSRKKRARQEKARR